MKLPRGAPALLCLVAIALFVPTANAKMELKLSDGIAAHDVDIKDGDPGDLCPVAGCVTFSGGVGVFIVNVSTGTHGHPGGIDLNSVDVGAGGGTLTIMLSDNGMSPLSNEFRLEIGGTIGGGTLDVMGFGGNSDTLFDTSHQIGSTLTFNTSPFAGETFGSVTGVAPYSLTIETILTFGALGGHTSYDASLDPVPEPSSVALLGGVLLLTAGVLRRKLRKS